MGAHQEVGHDTRPIERAPPPVLLPEATGKRRGVGSHGLEANPEDGERVPEPIVVGEVCAHLGPNHVAGEQRARPVRRPKRFA